MAKMMRLTMLVLAGAVMALPVNGQVVREEGVKSIAGVLRPAESATPSAEWTFKSAGGEVLFATLDADIYRVQTDHHEDGFTAAEEEPGGCGGEGGPGLFKLTVLDGAGAVLCSASRPAPPPGWQRDPRLACNLPVAKGQVMYRLRVELAKTGEEPTQVSYPFLLNASLRKIAPTGVNIQEAFAASGGGGF